MFGFDAERFARCGQDAESRATAVEQSVRGDEYQVFTARDLGAALKHFRTTAGVTQADAAEAMGIGQPYLSSLEGGKFGSSLTHALRLLRFVGCEVIVRRTEGRG